MYNQRRAVETAVFERQQQQQCLEIVQYFIFQEDRWVSYLRNRARATDCEARHLGLARDPSVHGAPSLPLPLPLFIAR